jgi:hypothetical protein
VLDSGDGVSHAVPVYEGFAMPSSIRRIDVAGRDVTEHFQMLLRKTGYVFHTSAEKEVVRLIKEAVSYVASDPKREEKEWASSKTDASKVAEYVLPDGNKLKVRLSPLLYPCAELQTADGIPGRLDLNASAPPRSSSTPRSLASSIPAYTRLLLTPSTGQTWTYANRFTVTSYCRAEAP